MINVAKPYIRLLYLGVHFMLTTYKSVYVRRMFVSYDTLSAAHTFLVRVVPNNNCNFLFAGRYSFRQLYPAAPTPFTSEIAETGTNAGTISNFANTGKMVQVTFDCSSELLTIPLQAFDSATTIRGSGSWGANGLNINYTTVTSAFTASGSIQGTR